MGTTSHLARVALVATLIGCDDDVVTAVDAARLDASDDLNFPRDVVTTADITDDDATREDATASDIVDVTPPPMPRNIIARENGLRGTGAWQIAHPAERGEVEGYASAVSVAAGASFALHVNVSEARDVRWEAYRVGYYDGEGGRLIAHGEAVRVRPQALCPVERATGMVACRWDAAFTVATDASWVTGLYLLKLVRDDGFESWVPMVVREATPRAPLVLQAAVNTWQAYNDWGGASLYVNALPQSAGFAGEHGYRVSFDRPYSASDYGSGQLLWWEAHMARWLERRGYDVAYTTNVDVDSGDEPVDARRMFITAGHDEYWTTTERDTLERARDLGVSLGFFSADTGTFHVRYAPSEDGHDRRSIVCYKLDGAADDPERGTPRQTTRFAEAPLARPENALLGVMYAQWTGGARLPMVVSAPSHWIFDGTHVEAGDAFLGVVGSEFDRVHDNGLTPQGLEVITASPGVATEGSVDVSHAAVHYPTPLSLVFAAGTLSWSLALGRSDVLDARVQRMTENILARAGIWGDGFTEVAPRSPSVLMPRVTTVTVLAGDGTAGYRDGPAMEARFNAPADVAVGPDGTLYVSEARNHRVRAISPAGVVRTVAGCGPDDRTHGNALRDGVADDACFDTPTGLALAPDGTLYVSDTGHHRIRAISTAGAVTTWAGSGEQRMRDGARSGAAFSFPRGLAWGSDGALYVADTGNDAVRRVTSTGVSTVMRDRVSPLDVDVDTEGRVYSTHGDGTLRAVVGVGTLLAGAPREYAFADGEGGDARLNPGDGVAVLGRTVVFADTNNNRVRAYDLDTRRVRTLLGDGRAGAEVTEGNARVTLPRGVAAWRDGFVVADSGNHRVLYVRP